MRKKTIFILFIFLLCSALVSCKKVPENKPIDKTGKSGKLANKKRTREDETTICKDVEGLVEVHIRDGKATVHFNIERWEELFNINEYVSTEELYGEAVSINGISTRVKDAVIVQIKELDYLNGLDGTAPTIFLLLEDGSVEWIFADIFLPKPDYPKLDSYGKLNWIGDIVSLSVENDGEGIGETTVYGIDFKGNKYDLKTSAKFSEIVRGQWIWNIEEIDSSSEDKYGVLTFSDKDFVIYEIGNLDGSDHTRYTGKYKLSIEEKSAERPGILSLDLTLDWTNNDMDMPREIHGKYFADAYNLINFKLWPSEGDPLYHNKGNNVNIDEYDFWLANDPMGGNFGMDNPLEKDYRGDYARFLVDKVAKAKEMVEKHGMNILETDNYVELPRGRCKEVWLGTNDKNKFTKEILYAIFYMEIIYEYDPVEDNWEIVWEN